MTAQPRFGNPGTRILELPNGGIMNSIGLENPGIEYFAKHISPQLAEKYKFANTKIIANISAATPEEFADMITRLDETCIHAYEINVSCPNLDKKIIGTDPGLVFDVVRAATDATGRPVIVKLSPNVANIAEIAMAAERAGADAISLINTVVGYDINPKTGRSTFYNGVAGISDHEIIRNIALERMINVAKVTGLPIIAGGGIKNAGDVVRFALAGANAFAIGTELLRNPKLMEILPADVTEFLEKHWNTRDIKKITGALHLNTENRTVAQAKMDAIKTR